MEIGELLKRYRLEKGLTQSEMTNQIISTSFYSKVENGQHRLAAEDLIELLKANDIMIADFFSKLEGDQGKVDFTRIAEEIVKCSYQFNQKQLKALRAELKKNPKLKATDRQLFSALIEGVEADYHQRELSQASHDYLLERFFSLSEWSYFKLTFYANITGLYSIENNQWLINSILKKGIENFEEEKRIAILVILLNFVGLCVSKNQDYLAAHYLEIIKEEMTLPNNYFYKTMASYYNHLLRYRRSENPVDREEIEEIAKMLNKIGLKEMAENLIVFFEKYSERK